MDTPHIPTYCTECMTLIHGKFRIHCIICGCDFCDEHISWCKECGAGVCNFDSWFCKRCNANVCNECIYKCDDCGKSMHHGRHCERCFYYSCCAEKERFLVCVDCDSVVCLLHAGKILEDSLCRRCEINHKD